MTKYFNGKPVTKLPKGAKLIYEVHQRYYGDKAYIEQQEKNTNQAFRKLREDREELERRHG